MARYSASRLRLTGGRSTPIAREADAVRLWDPVVALAEFPGFAELKRSPRERPQLASFGVASDQVGAQEDWHGGSPRRKK